MSKSASITHTVFLVIVNTRAESLAGMALVVRFSFAGPELNDMRPGILNGDCKDHILPLLGR